MKVLLLEPGKLAKEMDIPRELSEMQRIVGGTIQAIYPFPEQAAVVCNDEGMLLGLPLNRVIDTNIVIAGACFICGLGEEDFTDLSPDLMERFKERYYWPRQSIRLNGELIALPYDPETK